MVAAGTVLALLGVALLPLLILPFVSDATYRQWLTLGVRAATYPSVGP